MNTKDSSIFLVFVIILTLGALSCNRNTGIKTSGLNEKVETGKNVPDSSMKNNIVDIDDVVKNPEQYKGLISVSGKVVQVNTSKSIFFLGCEDACVLMPVKFNGILPEKDKDIIAYGEIKTAVKGKYIFEATDYKLK